MATVSPKSKAPPANGGRGVTVRSAESPAEELTPAERLQQALSDPSPASRARSLDRFIGETDVQISEVRAKKGALEQETENALALSVEAYDRNQDAIEATDKEIAHLSRLVAMARNRRRELERSVELLDEQLREEFELHRSAYQDAVSALNEYEKLAAKIRPVLQRVHETGEYVHRFVVRLGDQCMKGERPPGSEQRLLQELFGTDTPAQQFYVRGERKLTELVSLPSIHPGAPHWGKVWHKAPEQERPDPTETWTKPAPSVTEDGKITHFGPPIDDRSAAPPSPFTFTHPSRK